MIHFARLCVQSFLGVTWMQIAIEIISLWPSNIATIQCYSALITDMLAGMWYTWESEGTRLITRKDYSVYVGQSILASAKLKR